jgi:hypothetical protein
VTQSQVQQNRTVGLIGVTRLPKPLAVVPPAGLAEALLVGLPEEILVATPDKSPIAA